MEFRKKNYEKTRKLASSEEVLRNPDGTFNEDVLSEIVFEAYNLRVPHSAIIMVRYKERIPGREPWGNEGDYMFSRRGLRRDTLEGLWLETEGIGYDKFTPENLDEISFQKGEMMKRRAYATRVVMDVRPF